MRIHKILIYCVKLDHVLYSINYSMYQLFASHNGEASSKLYSFYSLTDDYPEDNA